MQATITLRRALSGAANPSPHPLTTPFVQLKVYARNLALRACESAAPEAPALVQARWPRLDPGTDT